VESVSEFGIASRVQELLLQTSVSFSCMDLLSRRSLNVSNSETIKMLIKAAGIPVHTEYQGLRFIGQYLNSEVFTLFLIQYK